MHLGEVQHFDAPQKVHTRVCHYERPPDTIISETKLFPTDNISKSV